jgi:hypothetical protein
MHIVIRCLEGLNNKALGNMSDGNNLNRWSGRQRFTRLIMRNLFLHVVRSLSKFLGFMILHHCRRSLLRLRSDIRNCGAFPFGTVELFLVGIIVGNFFIGQIGRLPISTGR